MSLIFLAEAQPRLDTGEDTLHFLGDRTNYKAKDTIEKITFFFIVFVMSLPTKTEIYYLQYTYLFT
jgi:hypothetical protein